jgi:hypothetical protein
MRTQARPVHKGNGRKQKFSERTVLSLRNNALSSTREGGARSSASLRGCGKAHATCVAIEPTLLHGHRASRSAGRHREEAVVPNLGSLPVDDVVSDNTWFPWMTPRHRQPTDH